jgi:hypothetical protein
VVWGSLGSCLRTSSCPRNLWQRLAWFYAFLSGDGKFYMLVTVTLCWSI